MPKNNIKPGLEIPKNNGGSLEYDSCQFEEIYQWYSMFMARIFDYSKTLSYQTMDITLL